MVSFAREYARTAFALASAVGVLSTAVADAAFAGPSRTVTSRDLATLRDLSSLSVSPDGAWAAFQVVQADPDRNGYDVAWYVAATAGGSEAHRVADGGGVGPFVSGSIRLEFYSLQPPPPSVWSPDSAWITYLRWDGERAQIWRTRPRGGAAEKLTHGEHHVRRFAYAPDGARILYEVEPSLAQTRDALAREGRTGFLFDDKFYPAYDIRPLQPDSMDFSAPVDLVEGIAPSQSASRAIWIYDLARRSARPATASEHAEFNALLAQPSPQGARRIRGTAAKSPNGATAWMDARDPKHQGYRPPVTIVSRQRGGHEPTICAAAACENQFIQGLWWRGDDELIFLRAEGPRGHEDGGMDTGLYAWRPADGRLRTILRTRARLLGHWNATGEAQSSCAIGSDRLVCFFEDWTAPRRLVAIDLDSGAIETLHEANPNFANLNFGPAPQRLEFRGTSGRSYYGVLALPPHRRPTERLPLVVITYRCAGFLRGGAGDEYPAYPLAAEGFAVLCLEKPDTSEQAATLDYTAFNRWAWQPGGEQENFLESLEAAIKNLDDAGIVDPKRVGITGLSRGAQLVGWAITGMPHLAAASASGAPGTPGPFAYYLLTDEYRKWGLDTFGRGNPANTPEQWRRSFSPNVERVYTPLLINAADHELMLALQPVIDLRDHGRAVEMFVYPDEFHWKWQPSHRLAIYNRNIDWMKFWLNGAEDPDRAKVTQYARWRAMREKRCGLFGLRVTERIDTSTPWYCRHKAAGTASKSR